ncbi:hypothetical protein CHUAL_013877 [Chamberlinius hualienensis]
MDIKRIRNFPHLTHQDGDQLTHLLPVVTSLEKAYESYLDIGGHFHPLIQLWLKLERRYKHAIAIFLTENYATKQPNQASLN